MEIDLKNIIYGECFNTLYQLKQNVFQLCNSNHFLIESFLISLCAELKISSISNENKKIILSFLLFNKEENYYHYWENNYNNNLSYEKWQQKQSEKTLECLNIFLKAEERFNKKLQDNVKFDDEYEFMGISLCFTTEKTNIIKLNQKTDEEKELLYKKYLAIICSQHLRLIRNPEN